jgi:hypothetical protein
MARESTSTRPASYSNTMQPKRKVSTELSYLVAIALGVMQALRKLASLDVSSL